MRHQHEGRGPLGEPLLEVLHRLDVQVVGGLIEQQQVGLGQQHLGQLHAPALAARERVHAALQVDVGEAEVEGQLARGRLQRVAAAPRIELLQLAVAGQVTGVLVALGLTRQLVLQLFELRPHRQQVGEGLEQRVPQGPGAVELLRLVQVRHGHAARAHRLPALGLERPREQPQQRGLAGAIGPHQPDAVARVHLEAEVAEDVGAGIPEGHVGELGEHGGGGVVGCCSNDQGDQPLARANSSIRPTSSVTHSTGTAL